MKIPLKKIDHVRWELPTSYKKGMKVPGYIYGDSYVVKTLESEQAYEQVANVACLPGIIKYSFAMPEIHWGYGFPIGGVAAFDLKEGIVSPGGVGYDISCGVRLMVSEIDLEEIEPVLDKVTSLLFKNIPCGVGSSGRLKLKTAQLDEVLAEGAKWAVKKGYGTKEDLEHIEEKGVLEGADPQKVSKRAKERGFDQLGTLGSGNHFLEIQVVDEVYDEKIAEALGLRLNQIVVMIHCGSRGLGHQVCDDYIKVMNRAMRRYNISVPDRQLCCAPIQSQEGQDYLQAMKAAANFALANREIIGHWVRETFYDIFKKQGDLKLLYDVSHNMAHIEKHKVNGTTKEVCVHRKGATRALGPDHDKLPQKYKGYGQPVIIPGSMGTASYVLVGTKRAEEEVFASTCHGAGRVMSRKAAIKATKGQDIVSQMEKIGVKVKAKGKSTLHEEVPQAYKDIDKVVEVVQKAGISRKVVKLKPIGVIKG